MLFIGFVRSFDVYVFIAIFNLFLVFLILFDLFLTINLLFYFLIFIVGAILLMAMGLDVETSLGASVASLSNVGTGIGKVGPGGSYVLFPQLAKWVLMLLMLLGRVELFSMITLFSRSFWKQ